MSFSRSSFSILYANEYKYLIVSANPENLGIIINMSLNLCTLFGFHKNELIDKIIQLVDMQKFKKFLITIELSLESLIKGLSSSI